MSMEEIHRTLWAGEIAVCFTLAKEDLNTFIEQPEVYCLTVPRVSYFPLHCEKLKAYFSMFVKTELKDSGIWLKCREHKIKWHVPIGVTYDLLYGLEGQGQIWHITVHFSNFPVELLHCKSLDAVKAQFMMSVKEADSLKHKSEVINAMQGSEHKMLWDGFSKRNFDEFWAMNQKLMKCDDQDTMFNNLPIRIHSTNRHYIQKLVPLYSDDAKTIQTSISEILQNSGLTLENTTVVSQGIEVPLEGTGCSLVQTLSYPDNFVHLCVISNQILGNTKPE